MGFRVCRRGGAMATMMSEVKQWLSNCSVEERAEIFSTLAREALLAPQPKPIPIQDDNSRILGYVMPGTSPAEWYGLTDPETMMEIRRRLANPGELLTLDELMEQAFAMADPAAGAK